MQADQGAANDQARGVNAGGGSGEERRQLAKGDGREDGAKEDEGAQPEAEREIDERVKESSHFPCSAMFATWVAGR